MAMERGPTAAQSALTGLSASAQFASQHTQTGHSSVVQHFQGRAAALRTKLPFAAGALSRFSSDGAKECRQLDGGKAQ